MTVEFATINPKREMGTGGTLWLPIQPIIPHSNSSTDAVKTANIATNGCGAVARPSLH